MKNGRLRFLQDDADEILNVEDSQSYQTQPNQNFESSGEFKKFPSLDQAFIKLNGRNHKCKACCEKIRSSQNLRTINHISKCKKTPSSVKKVILNEYENKKEEKDRSQNSTKLLLEYMVNNNIPLVSVESTRDGSCRLAAPSRQLNWQLFPVGSRLSRSRMSSCSCRLGQSTVTAEKISRQLPTGSCQLSRPQLRQSSMGI